MLRPRGITSQGGIVHYKSPAFIFILFLFKKQTQKQKQKTKNVYLRTLRDAPLVGITRGGESWGCGFWIFFLQPLATRSFVPPPHWWVTFCFCFYCRHEKWVLKKTKHNNWKGYMVNYGLPLSHSGWGPGAILKGPYADHIHIPQGSAGSSIFFDIKWKPYFSFCKSKISASNSL